MKQLFTGLALTALLAGCQSSPLRPMIGLPASGAFTDSINGRPTNLFILENQRGMRAAFSTYGGRLVSLLVPDKNGQPTSVVVGFDSVWQYKTSTEPYFGATIGRYGNRIAAGRFTLDSIAYTLPLNNGPNALHGGKGGFQDRVWNAIQPDDSTLILLYRSIDGECGFPGNVDVWVTYRLVEGNALQITYDAGTDRRTELNLTNHAFFNLNGEGSGSILDHALQINADAYTPVDSTLIPTGEIAPVRGTAFDFALPTTIGKRIGQTDTQLQYGRGYDHNFVCRGSGFRKVATVTGNKSGIRMDVLTTEPGLQFYSGNFMEGKNQLRGGVWDEFRTAFCLETQHFPNSPNQPNFPSTVVNPGARYHTETRYTFTK